MLVIVRDDKGKLLLLSIDANKFQKLLANTTQSMVVVREFAFRNFFKKQNRVFFKQNTFIFKKFKKLEKMVLKFVGTSFDPKIKQPHSGECSYDRGGICIHCIDTFNEEQMKEEKSLEGQEYFALESLSFVLFIAPERLAKHFDGELHKASHAFERLSEGGHKFWIGKAKECILVEEAAAKAEKRLPFWEFNLERDKMKANSKGVTRKRKASLMSSLDIEIAKWEKYCKAAEAMKKFAESKKDAEKGASSSNQAEKLASSSKQGEKGASSSNNAEK